MRALSTLPSRSDRSVNRRNSAAASGSCSPYPSGNSRASAGSVGARRIGVDPDHPGERVGVGGLGCSGATAAISWVANAAAALARPSPVAPTIRPVAVRRNPCTATSVVLLERRPEPVRRASPRCRAPSPRGCRCDTTARPFWCTSSISRSAFVLGVAEVACWKTYVTYDIRLTGSFHTMRDPRPVGQRRSASDAGLLDLDGRDGSRAPCSRARAAPRLRRRRPRDLARPARAAHRPLRADDAAGRPAQRRGRAPLRVRGVRPPAAATAGATAWSPAPAGCSTRSRPSASAPDELAALADAQRRRRARPWSSLAAYRFTGDDLGVRRGRAATSPGRRSSSVEGTLRRGACCSRPSLLSVLNHDSAVAAAGAPDDRRRRRPAVHRDGVAAHPRAGGGRRRPRGVPRRVRHDEQPRGRPRATACRPRAPRAHAFTLLHDDERERVRGAGRRARRGHHAARRHLRRRRGGRGSASSCPAAGSAPSGSTPATCSTQARQVRAQLDALGATGTRIVVTGDLDEYAIAALRRRPGRRVRRRHLARHRLRRPDGGPGLQARRPPDRGPVDRCCRSPSAPPTSRATAVVPSPAAGSTTGPRPSSS